MLYGDSRSLNWPWDFDASHISNVALYTWLAFTLCVLCYATGDERCDGNPAWLYATDVVLDYLILLWPENKYNQISFKPN
jgi:hypothetical protein